MRRQRQVAALFLLLAVPAGVRRFHYSFWSDNPQPYLEAIKKSAATIPPALASGESIRAGIVTHHFLASGLMVRFFATLHAQSSPKTIVLIGPNHFHHGSANISVSSLPWKTPFGLVEADADAVQQIKSAIHLPEDPEAFTGEHSVGVLIPFLRYYFPQCRVVPILVDVNARQSQVQELRGVLGEFLRSPRALVLLSMDFSHNSVASVADSRDALAERAMTGLDFDEVDGLQVDCRKGLWLLLASLRDLGNVRAQIGEHTNSGRLTGNSHQPDVTSYFSVYFLR